MTIDPVPKSKRDPFVAGMLTVLTLIFIVSVFAIYLGYQRVTLADTGSYELTVINNSQVDLGLTKITFLKLPDHRPLNHNKGQVVGFLKIPTGLANQKPMIVEFSESPFEGEMDYLIVAKVLLHKQHCWPYPFYFQLPLSPEADTLEINAVRARLAKRELVIPFFVYERIKRRADGLEAILEAH